jgi:hypothetical protein
MVVTSNTRETKQDGSHEKKGEETGGEAERGGNQRMRRRKPIQRASLEARTLTLGSFSLKTSILFRNKIIDVRRNHLELTTASKSARDSDMWVYKGRSKQVSRWTREERMLGKERKHILNREARERGRRGSE